MIQVLVVDDDPLMAEAHAKYVTRVEGFAVTGVVHRGQDVPAFLSDHRVDVVLLDMNLPDVHGLDVARRLRAAGATVDIIAITAVREMPIIQGAIAVGVVQYLMKPFTFAAFAEKLANYRHFREQLHASEQGSQQQVDQALARLRSPVTVPLPKGLSPGTLEKVIDLLRTSAGAVSAQELTESLGISRVTARRYLEHLVESGQVARTARYGTPGRPENQYTWATR